MILYLGANVEVSSFMLSVTNDVKSMSGEVFLIHLFRETALSVGKSKCVVQSCRDHAGLAKWKYVIKTEHIQCDNRLIPTPFSAANNTNGK